MPISHKPTHLLPLNEAELAYLGSEAAKSRKWQGGPRFNYVSKFGSKSSNSGTRRPGKGSAKNKNQPERRTIVPPWARKYA